MAKIFSIHPENPQTRGIEQIQAELRRGAVMLYPTDTVYAIGCDLNVKSAVERVRQIKQLANNKPLTFLCPSLSDIATYAFVSDNAYRTMKRLIPGPYTFLLPATKLVPKLVQNPKRKTTGIRVPNHNVCLALLSALGNPIISTSAHLPLRDSSVAYEGASTEGGFPSAGNWRWKPSRSAGSPPNDGVDTDFEQGITQAELFNRLDDLVDVIVDTGEEPTANTSTILDLTGSEPVLVRQGLGIVDFGL